MSGNVKLGGYKGGRGYCGYYINNDNKKMFLRSTQEFMIAKFLDYNHYHFLTEKKIFIINNETYKPDFFIYDESYTKLIKIIEVKDSKKLIDRYISYKPFFEKLNIEYEIFTGFDKRKKYEFVSSDEINIWIKTYLESYGSFNYIGEKNPMYGIKHSEETKQKISKKSKESMSNEQIKIKHSNSLKKFWNSEKANEIKKKYSELRTKEKQERLLKNPIEKRKCVYCESFFEVRKNSLKLTCSNSCSQKYSWKIGKNKYNGNSKKSYSTKIINYLKMYKDIINEDNFDLIIIDLKNQNLIPKNFGINKSTIIKYFGSIKILMENLNG